MRFVFLLGGLLGFVLAGAASWWGDSTPGRIFFDASLGCLFGAVLFRWLWSVLLGGLRETFVARQQSALAAEAKNPTHPMKP
jgi:hypothetical protein